MEELVIVVSVMAIGGVLSWVGGGWGEEEEEGAWMEVFCREIENGRDYEEARRSAVKWMVDVEGEKWDEAEWQFDNAVECRWGVRIDTERREDKIIDALKKAVKMDRKEEGRTV